MARRLSPYGIKAHPMLHKIIDAILEGKESDGQIAKWVQPSLSRTSIQNYRKSVVEPSMRQADLLKQVLPQNKIENTPLTSCQAVQELPDNLARTALLAAPVLAVRENRIKAQQDRHDRLKLIMDERGVEMDGETAGGASGLLARDYKADGKKVFKVDATLLSEFREHEKQIAQELGQWQEAAGVNVAVQIVVPAQPLADNSRTIDATFEYSDIN